jgi:hypothetical protein
MANIPLLYKYLKQKKVGELHRPHFRFQRCQWNRFWRLSKRLSRQIRCHMQKGFSLLIRDIYGVDWWKKPRVENLVLLCKSATEKKRKFIKK